MQLLERAIRGEDKDENEWLKVQPVAVAVTETDLEPQDYDLDISREVTLIILLPTVFPDINLKFYVVNFHLLFQK